MCGARESKTNKMEHVTTEPHPHPGSSPAVLCSACRKALQSGLEIVLDKRIYYECDIHHRTFVEFQRAVAQSCFICVKLWDSIREETLSSWATGTNWLPLKCSLSRRPWAAEQYEPIYWHFIYMQFDFPQLDHWDVNYPGNVFCLFKNADSAEKQKTPDKIQESSTGSEKVHGLACTWYKACRESHGTCKKLGPSKRYTPTRLIDVGSEGESTWKLCINPDDIQHSPEYLTLSYRWSKNPDLLLRTSTVKAFRQGIAIDALPKTFRDAVTVARSFAIRYLWIDSLCIIQDSPEDWARESILMNDVYTNSACNIAASASESPEGGLFRARSANQVKLGYISIDVPSIGTANFEIWDQFYMDRLTHGPLANRGWVFQERVLSPRVLHFSQTQIAWECFEMNKCETFPNHSPQPTEGKYAHSLKTLYAFFESESGDNAGCRRTEEGNKKKVMSSDVYDQWIRLVKTYSTYAFTCPEDRLVAMAGVAKLFERHTGDDYLAGLWKSRLIEGLNWIAVNPLPQPPERRAPSWSWAAVDSAVLPQAVNLPRDHDLIEIMSVDVDYPSTSSGWRKVRGQIKLKGSLVSATIQEGCDKMVHHRNASATPIKLLGFPPRFFVLADTSDVTFDSGQLLQLLPLRSTLRRQMAEEGAREQHKLFGTTVVIIEGMILEPVASGCGIYRRIGRFVLQELGHIGFFGLRTFPPSEGGVTTPSVFVDEARTSTFTLI